MQLTVFVFVLISHIGSVFAVCKVDVVFLVDTSSSIGTTNFQKVKDFIANSVKHFTIGPSATRVSVVTFSTNVHDVFYLSRYSGKTSLLHAISRIPYEGLKTYTGKALKHVRQVSFTTAHGDRRDARNVLVIITDGAPSDLTDTIAEAKLLEKAVPNLLVFYFPVDTTGIFGSSFINLSKLFHSTITTMVHSMVLLKDFDSKVHSITCNSHCRDAFPSCSTTYHGKAVCTRYTHWSAVNCASYCDVCPGKCEDHRPDCSQHGLKNCSINNYYMYTNCRKYCNFCNVWPTATTTTKITSPPTTTTVTTTTTTVGHSPNIIPVDKCTDRLTNCDKYGLNVCVRYKQWATHDCPRYCHFCDAEPETTKHVNSGPLVPIFG